jgi:hypothetical protein
VTDTERDRIRIKEHLLIMARRHIVIRARFGSSECCANAVADALIDAADYVHWTDDTPRERKLSRDERLRYALEDLRTPLDEEPS